MNWNPQRAGSATTAFIHDALQWIADNAHGRLDVSSGFVTNSSELAARLRELRLVVVPLRGATRHDREVEWRTLEQFLDGRSIRPASDSNDPGQDSLW